MKFRMTLFGLLAVLWLTGANAFAQSRTYKIEASESSFWVFVGKAGLLSGLAHNHEIGVKSFTGRVVIVESTAAGATLELEAEAKSLTVLDKEVSDKDRNEIFNSMHNTVLESAKYPKISFRSVSVGEVKQSGSSFVFTLSGDLTLHGVTKRIAIPVIATITPQRIKAEGKYALRQTDFGIKPYSAAGGTIKVKNEITVNFSIIAKNQ